MNFGADIKANLGVTTRQPTYHLAPNFTTRPFPEGPLDLGTLVEDLQSFYPINHGASRIPIPDGQRYVDVKDDVISSVRSSSSHKTKFLARILDSSIGGDASLKGKRSEENVYKIAQLETACFYPSPTYIKQCLRLDEVQDYLEMANHKVAVYLITGLKIARGATVATKRGRELNGKAGADIRVPTGLIDAEFGGHAAFESESGTVSSFSRPADFVLGIQVLKLYHRRAFLAVKLSLATKRVIHNAVLVDNDPVPEEEEEEEEDENEMFTIADVDQSDVEGFTPTYIPGEDELWFIPRDLT